MGKGATYMKVIIVLTAFVIAGLTIASQLSKNFTFTMTPILVLALAATLVMALISILRQTGTTTDLDRLSKPLIVIAVVIAAAIFMVKYPQLFEGFSTAITDMKAVMKITPVLNSIV